MGRFILTRLSRAAYSLTQEILIVTLRIVACLFIVAYLVMVLAIACALSLLDEPIKS